MNIEETNKVLWKYSKKKATYELQKEKGLSFNDDDYEASVICDYLLELVAYNNYQKEEIERLNKEIKRLKQKLLIGKKANILYFDEIGVDKE